MSRRARPVDVKGAGDYGLPDSEVEGVGEGSVAEKSRRSMAGGNTGEKCTLTSLAGRMRIPAPSEALKYPALTPPNSIREPGTLPVESRR